jgi:uncharacterized zinc-type alcohol dehydrogenase-like protein
MAVKFSHAFGAHTVMFTTTAAKAEDARRLGADEVVVGNDADAMKAHASSFDLIIDTVSASHDLDAYTQLLRRDGTLTMLGVPDQPHPAPAIGKLIGKRRRIAGSLIGGIRETQDMLDFCAEHNIVSDIELVPVQQINQAYARMVKSDVKYRFVLDLASLAKG